MPFWNKMFHKSNNLKEGVKRVTLFDVAEEIGRNMSINRGTLLDIPEEIVRYITRYLMMEDVLHLSMTCKIFYHMLPKYSFECKKIDIDIEHRPNWQYRSYLDTPPFTSHIFMATISGKILVDKDLEWEFGYRTATINIQLIRPRHGSKEFIVIARHQTKKVLNRPPDRN